MTANAINFKSLDKYTLKEIGVSDSTADFLANFGLPADKVLDFLFVTNAQEITVKRIGNQTFAIVGRDFYGNLIGVSLKNDSVNTLYEDDILFANTNVYTLIEFIKLCMANEYVSQYNSDEQTLDAFVYDEEQAAKSVKELKSRMRQIDKKALKSEEYYWPTFLENWETFDD